MKQLLILILAVTVSGAAFSQGKNVNQADAAFKKGEFAEAASLIEPAITHEKTMNKGRTWYVRGQIYGAIALSTEQAVRDIDPEALKKAVESYQKVLEMEKEGSTYHGMAEINLDGLKADVMNRGVEAYQGDDYQAAFDAFVEYTHVAPQDTTGYIYAALMAQQLEHYEDVIAYYEKCFNLDYYPKSGLNMVIYYYMNEFDNAEKALEYANLAQEKYPEDSDFQKTAVDIYIKLDKMDEAINELKEAIELEPDNARLYSNLGMLYDSQENYEQAVEQYKKALEIDPNDRFSLINMAVFYIGRGDAIFKKGVEMDINTYRKEGDRIEKEADAEWEKAIPFLEKVLETNDTDELALQNLHAVYFKLKDTENAAKIEKKRKELGYIIE